MNYTRRRLWDGKNCDYPDEIGSPGETIPYEQLQVFTGLLARFEGRGLHGFYCHWDWGAPIITDFDQNESAGRVLGDIYDFLLRGVPVPSDEEVFYRIEIDRVRRRILEELSQ